MSSDDLRKPVAYPFTGSMVGGTYIVAAAQARLLSRSPQWKPELYLPLKGPNATVFEQNDVLPHYYGLSEADVVCIRNPCGIQANARTLPVHFNIVRIARRLLKQLNPRIVHIHDIRTLVNWGVAAKMLSIPVIWHVHQECGSHIRDLLNIRIADFLILNSRATLQRFSRFRRIPEYGVVHNAIDTSRFSPSPDKVAEKRKWGLDPNKITIGYVGSLVARKRPEWLFESAVLFEKRGMNVQIVIAGADHTDGQYVSLLRDRYADVTASGSLVYLGHRQEIPSLMRALDIFAMPSYQESFGLVYGEAMASGVPAVGCAVGGVPEVVMDGVTGRLLPDGDFNAFIDALQSLIQDSGQRLEMGAAGRRHVEATFSEQAMMQGLLDIYDRLSSKR